MEKDIIYTKITQGKFQGNYKIVFDEGEVTVYEYAGQSFYEPVRDPIKIVAIFQNYDLRLKTDED